MARNQTETAPSPGQSLDGQGVLRIPRLKIVKSKIRIATWNVRSLYASGKLDNLANETKRLNIDLMGISEVRWPGSGSCARDDGTLYYSGCDSNDRGHRNGVGIFVAVQLVKYVSNFVPISERILLLQLSGSPFNINVLQVYAPTSERKYDNEVEAFYSQITNIMRSFKSSDITYIMGDFNAKLGQGIRTDLVGPFGLGESNDRGDKLFEFCQEHDLVVTNTWYKLPKRRLYTWKAPSDNPQHTVRNQIDYILVNKRFRNSVKRVCTYPGADISSDHNPLVANLEIHLKKIHKKPRTKTLQPSNFIDHNLQNDLNNQLRDVRVTLNVTEAWNNLKSKMQYVIDKYSQTNKQIKKKKWMTDEILELMEKRRMVKNNRDEYRTQNKLIKRKIREAKEKWMEENCREMEEMESRYDMFGMHRKLREVAGLYGRRTPCVLVNDRNKLIIDEGEIASEWEAYLREVFRDDRSGEREDSQPEDGPSILNSEVLNAVNIAKTKKTVGPDGIPVELLKMINEENMQVLVDLFNHVYFTGEIPDDWVKSTFVTLPKKQRAKHCSDYRLISLMSHTLKVFLRIIHGRIRRKCEEDLDNSQFGFRNNLGTRDALFAINVLLQKCRDQRADVFACFIDYEKAFDRVKHTRLIEILQDAGVDGRDIRIIRNLYWRQTGAIRFGDRFTEDVAIQRGVRQGCVLSPLLFNLYSDKIFKEALYEQPFGVKVNGTYINTIRYADDTVILAHKIEDLQYLLNRVNQAGVAMGLNINIAKTKYMVFSRQRHPDTVLHINGQQIERVNQFKYLGSLITYDLDPDREIKVRIETARITFCKMRSLFCNDSLNLKIRQRMLKCYIWSVLLYGVETWTLKAATINRLEAFEMWLHRRMLRIPWTALQTNEEVLNRANAVRELLTAIKCRKMAYLGHILRGSQYQLLQLIMKGKIEGRRGVGRRQASWLKNIRDWTGIQSAAELFRLAQNRDDYARVIANVRET